MSNFYYSFSFDSWVTWKYLFISKHVKFFDS